MKILAIAGSASPKGSNFYLLEAMQRLSKEKHAFTIYDHLQKFPLFTPEKLERGAPEIVVDFKNKLLQSDAVIIATPEYTHNIPAVLKNMLEWCTHSGEFSAKKVLPITFTPYEPRGKYAMQSLHLSLQALDTNIITQLCLFKSEVEIKEGRIILPKEIEYILTEAIELF